MFSYSKNIYVLAYNTHICTHQNYIFFINPIERFVKWYELFNNNKKQRHIHALSYTFEYWEKYNIFSTTLKIILLAKSTRLPMLYALRWMDPIYFVLCVCVCLYHHHHIWCDDTYPDNKRIEKRKKKKKNQYLYLSDIETKMLRPLFHLILTLNTSAAHVSRIIFYKIAWKIILIHMKAY